MNGGDARPFVELIPLAVAVVLGIVAIWFAGALVAWMLAGATAAAVVAATVILLAAVTASVVVGTRRRERSWTAYW